MGEMVNKVNVTSRKGGGFPITIHNDLFLLLIYHKIEKLKEEYKEINL